MSIHNDTTDIVTQTLENSSLENAISSMVNDPSMRNMDYFVNELISSSLIVLIKDFIHEDSGSFDEEGYFTLSQFDNIPLVKIENDKGQFEFPAFTCVTYAESLPHFVGFIPLIVPTVHVLEMAQMMNCEKITINMESDKAIEIDKVLIDSMIFRLITEGNLSLQNTFM